MGLEDGSASAESIASEQIFDFGTRGDPFLPGPPVVPVLTPFLVGRVRDPTKIDYGKKGHPYSNLSTGGPQWFLWRFGL